MPDTALKVMTSTVMKNEEADPTEPVKYEPQETPSEESDEADEKQVPAGSLEKSDVDIRPLSP